MIHCLHTTSIPNNLCWDIPWLLLKSSLVMLLLYWIIAPKSFFNKKMQQMYKLSLSSWLPLAIYTKIATSESAKEREDSLRWNVSWCVKKWCTGWYNGMEWHHHLKIEWSLATHTSPYPATEKLVLDFNAHVPCLHVHAVCGSSSGQGRAWQRPIREKRVGVGVCLVETAQEEILWSDFFCFCPRQRRHPRQSRGNTA